MATARTNARETLAQTIEAAEVLTWKNIGSATAVVPPADLPPASAQRPCGTGGALEGEAPEPKPLRDDARHAEGRGLPADCVAAEP